MHLSNKYRLQSQIASSSYLLALHRVHLLLALQGVERNHEFSPFLVQHLFDCQASHLRGRVGSGQ